MSDGKREARTAAQWWADQLAANDPQRTGEAMHEAFADYARSKMERPSPEQVEVFRAHLEEAILQMLREPASAWDAALSSGEPNRGGALRTVAVDYNPGGILKDAADAAGVKTRLLPVKTCMWINPGQVRVGHGYNAAPVELDLADR